MCLEVVELVVELWPKASKHVEVIVVWMDVQPLVVARGNGILVTLPSFVVCSRDVQAATSRIYVGLLRTVRHCIVAGNPRVTRPGWPIDFGKHSYKM